MERSSKLTVKDKLILIEYDMEREHKSYSPTYVAKKLGISIRKLREVANDLRLNSYLTKPQLFSSTKLTSKGKKLANTIQLMNGILIILVKRFRKSIIETPNSEKKVQNSIESMLAILDIPYERETETVPTSTKYTIPDFTFPDLDLALEIKFCKSKIKEKEIIDQINADITSYSNKYHKLIFVVYDISTIRDRVKFEKGFEKGNEDVYVIVIKH